SAARTKNQQLKQTVASLEEHLKALEQRVLSQEEHAKLAMQPPHFNFLGARWIEWPPSIMSSPWSVSSKAMKFVLPEAGPLRVWMERVILAGQKTIWPMAL